MERLFLLVEEFRKAALYGGHRRVILAQENIREIAPEVAIILLAELQRCSEYCNGRTVISGTYPKTHEVAELLTNLGFYDALKVPPPSLPGSYDRRNFIKVVSGHETNSETIDLLLSEFDQVLRLSSRDKKNLHVAILECMDNVKEHAYEESSRDPHLFREWWLVGIADKVTNTASFIFFDQGYGIAKTIKTFERKRLKGSFPALTDAGWIKKAMTQRMSRHVSKRRGWGLPKLRQFIDDAELTGSMRVIANRGEYRQRSQANASAMSFSMKATGTMISWSLTMPPDAQLRLDI
jgi:hypothetical protein